MLDKVAARRRFYHVRVMLRDQDSGEMWRRQEKAIADCTAAPVISTVPNVLECTGINEYNKSIRYNLKSKIRLYPLERFSVRQSVEGTVVLNALLE